MPNPLTSEERARLIDDLRTFEERAACFADTDILDRAAAELARTADDARDAERYRWLRQNGRAIHIEICVPPYGNGVLHGVAADEAIDEAIAEEAMRSRIQAGTAHLASSKSEAAEGGEE